MAGSIKDFLFFDGQRKGYGRGDGHLVQAVFPLLSSLGRKTVPFAGIVDVDISNWAFRVAVFPVVFMMLAIARERFFSWNSLKGFWLNKLHIHFSGEPMVIDLGFSLDDSRFFTSLGEKKTATGI